MGYTDDKTSEGARGGSTYAGRNFRVVGEIGRAHV